MVSNLKKALMLAVFALICASSFSLQMVAFGGLNDFDDESAHKIRLNRLRDRRNKAISSRSSYDDQEETISSSNSDYVLSEVDFYSNDYFGFNILHRAIRDKDVILAKKIINDPRISRIINKQTFRDRQTALHLAAQNQNEEICELLIGAGADSEIKNFDGRSALSYFDDYEVLLRLSRLIAQIEVGTLDSNDLDNESISFRGSDNEQEETISYSNSDSGYKNIWSDGEFNGLGINYTPLHIAAENDDEIALIKVLKDQRSSSILNVQDNFNKQTALHIAAKNQNIRICKLLIEAGTDITLTDYRDKEALSYIENISDQLDLKVIHINNIHQRRIIENITASSSTLNNHLSNNNNDNNVALKTRNGYAESEDKHEYLSITKNSSLFKKLLVGGTIALGVGITGYLIKTYFFDKNKQEEKEA